MTTDAIAPPRDSDVSLTVSSVGTSNINISSFAETCLKIYFLNCSLPRTGGWNRRSIYAEYSVVVVVFINIPITRQILPPVSRSSCSCSVGVFFFFFSLSNHSKSPTYFRTPALRFPHLVVGVFISTFLCVTCWNVAVCFPLCCSFCGLWDLWSGALRQFRWRSHLPVVPNWRLESF